MDFNTIGIIASIIAAIFAFLSYVELQNEKIPHNTIIRENLLPKTGYFYRPIFPLDSHRIHIDKVKLSIRGADAHDFYALAISNPKDFRKILAISREGISIEERDLEGELYFPLCHLDLFEISPNCEIDEWNVSEKLYKVTLNIDAVIKKDFFLIVANESEHSEVVVDGILLAFIEKTFLSKIKKWVFTKILKLKRENDNMEEYFKAK